MREANQNPDYHREGDTHVDFEYMGKFARLGLVYLAELAKGKIAQTFNVESYRSL